MKRRNFLKWLGIVPVCAGLGIKIPWPNPKPELMFGSLEGFTIHTHDEPFYKPFIGENQAIYSMPYPDGRKLKFDPKNYGVVALKTYKA